MHVERNVEMPYNFPKWLKISSDFKLKSLGRNCGNIVKILSANDCEPLVMSAKRLCITKSVKLSIQMNFEFNDDIGRHTQTYGNIWRVLGMEKLLHLRMDCKQPPNFLWCFVVIWCLSHGIRKEKILRNRVHAWHTQMPMSTRQK